MKSRVSNIHFFNIAVQESGKGLVTIRFCVNLCLITSFLCAWGLVILTVLVSRAHVTISLSLVGKEFQYPCVPCGLKPSRMSVCVCTHTHVHVWVPPHALPPPSTMKGACVDMAEPQR